MNLAGGLAVNQFLAVVYIYLAGTKLLNLYTLQIIVSTVVGGIYVYILFGWGMLLSSHLRSCRHPGRLQVHEVRHYCMCCS